MISAFHPATLRVSVAALAFLAGGECAYGKATDDHPRLAPTRDVTVVYRLDPQTDGANGQGKDVRVAFAGSGDLIRIDSADGKGVTILDRPHNLVTLIMHSQRLYTQLHPQRGLHNPFLLDVSMHYARTGQSVIAGAACTRWSITNAHGQSEACVTDDGVILAEKGIDADGARGAIQALSVTYADLPLAMFAPPAGFHPISVRPPVTPLPAAPSVGPGAAGVAPEAGQPPVPNDSATDGTVTQPDQPLNGAAHAPTDGAVPRRGGE